MNFFTVIIFGYFVLAGYLLYIFYRDQKVAGYFLNRHKFFSWTVIITFLLGYICAFDAYFVEPWTIKATYETVPVPQLTTPIKIAFVSDLQIGNHKKIAWAKKIVERLGQEKPDLIILGGDLIDNEDNYEDESQYLEPLKKLAGKYPIYYILGNHEYGISNRYGSDPEVFTGNRSASVIDRMKQLGITLLRDDLACPEIKGQKICLFGIDDIWHAPNPNFSELANVPTGTPLIFLTHNPDGILSWPKNLRAPDLVLAGHTHGGQIYWPGVGPLGDAGVKLGHQFYRGLNYFTPSVIPNESEGYSLSQLPMPIFTSVGIGESGGQLRFWTLPEIAVITLKPAN